MDLYFLDTETTGFGRCYLVELAFKKNGEPIRVFRTRPPIPIEQGAIETHGITNEDVAGLPLFQDHPSYEEIKAALESGVIIAHSADFDLGVLQREGINCTQYIDTKRVARRLFPNATNHKLQTLRNYLHLEAEGEAHSAEGDVAVLHELYQAMKREIEKKGTPESEVVALMIKA